MEDNVTETPIYTANVVSNSIDYLENPERKSEYSTYDSFTEELIGFGRGVLALGFVILVTALIVIFVVGV